MAKLDTENIIPIALEKEVKDSYLTYAMSVIVSRALPDVRDGLKPVHRRILYSMADMGLRNNSAHKKTGRIVGDVLGKYHPHGDQSIYDALVRLAQDFSMRYMLIDGQGNFGSIDGDPPAAMRYTEARLEKIADEMLRDINKDTVNFRQNYDESLKEPEVLPATMPNLLANGASGIAVGMATNIPPHNLREIFSAVQCYINNPDCTTADLCKHIKGPDFPTRGEIFGAENLQKIYETGRGQFVVRGKLTNETDKRGRERLVITELPYLVSKSALVTKIADLAKAQKIKGIGDLRDESDREGMRIVIELKRDTDPLIITNKLFYLTPLQSNFNPNMVALVNGRPQTLTIKDLVSQYVFHRREIVTRRSVYDLNTCKERKHILDGLILAMEHIDEIIRIIRNSKDVAAAKTALTSQYNFDNVQAQSILEMRLQRLTNLEYAKLEKEHKEVVEKIAYLENLLAHKKEIDRVVVEELKQLTDNFGDDRKTSLHWNTITGIDEEELIQPEEAIIILTNSGYIKRVPSNTFRLQGRGGRGSAATTGKPEDIPKNILLANTTDYLFLISNSGKIYRLRVYDIPSSSRTAKGRHLRGMISIQKNETIASVFITKIGTSSMSVLFATSNGKAKRTPISKFESVRTRGVKALALARNDSVVSALLSDGNEHLFLISGNGKGLLVGANSFRSMDRGAAGVNAINLSTDDTLVNLTIVPNNYNLLLVSKNGYAKRLKGSLLQKHARGTRGQNIFSVSEKTGPLVFATAVSDNDNILIALSNGNISMISAKDISLQQRAAHGIHCIETRGDECVVAVGIAPT